MHAVSKQPAERLVVAIDFAKDLNAGEAITSVQVLACLLVRQETLLAAGAAAGQSTMTVSQDVKVGARVILADHQANREAVQVTAVSGTGPYLATITPPLALDHQMQEPVVYDPGAPEVVDAANVAISGTKVLCPVKQGVACRDYQVTILSTVTTLKVLEGDFVLRVEVL